MAPIPGWAYILAGAVISGVSKVIENTSSEPGRFKFFFFIGLLFIAIGIGKMVYRGLLGRLTGEHGKREKRAYPGQPHQLHPQRQQHPRLHHTHPAPDANQHGLKNLAHQDFRRGEHHVNQIHQPAYDHPSVLHCPACGIKHYSYANFCMMCGAHIRKGRGH